MLDLMPTELADQIRSHLRSGCAHAEQGWESAEADEDTLTGDLGASLRTGFRTVMTEDGRTWKWRLKYAKFRGRGTGAEEKHTGADGIFQIEIEDTNSGEIQGKGMLFQAKKHNDRRKKKLVEQAEIMEALAPDASAVFEYGPRQYRGFDAKAVFSHTEDSFSQKGSDRLGDFLSGEFLPCKVGMRGLYYEGSRRTLFIPKSTKGFRRVRKRLKHSFRIEVRGA